MGEKDIAEKLLEDYNDVFADIINVLLFNGERIILEDDLETDTLRSQYKADGKLHEQERDVSKRWKSQNICFSIFGLENQTKQDKSMPFRIMGYDGASYRKQLLSGKKNPVPVVTLVLYYNTEDRWSAPVTLYDAFVQDVPEN